MPVLREVHSLQSGQSRVVLFGAHLICLRPHADTWHYALKAKPKPGQRAFLPPDATWYGPFPSETAAIEDAQHRIEDPHY